MKSNYDIIKEYLELIHLYYGRDEAMKIVIQNVLDSNDYRTLKDSICEDYIKDVLNNVIVMTKL